MEIENIKLTIYGCGKMGQAILGGLLDSNSIHAQNVYAIVRKDIRVTEIEDKYGVKTFTEPTVAIEGSDIILLCLKPQNAIETIAQHAHLLKDKLLISICAGIQISEFQEHLANTRIIRAMPNTPCLIREGMSVISGASDCRQNDLELAKRIFSSVGRCLILQEKHMDAVTGLSGSGPAFACVVLEALADGGVMMGLPREVAVELAAQTMQGAARLVLQSGYHPAHLKDQVTTPAGCTIAGLLTMEDGRIRSTLARTIQEATKVAGTLGIKK